MLSYFGSSCQKSIMIKSLTLVFTILTHNHIMHRVNLTEREIMMGKLR